MINSNKEGIECPHCGHWNLHDEIGTYEVLVPLCVECGMCTEARHMDEDEE